MANAMVALANLTLGSSQSTVTFSSIPTSGYRDLRIVINGMAGSGANMQGRINGDSGANYNRVVMTGDGTTTYSTSDANQTSFNYQFYATFNGATRSIVTLDYLDSNAVDKHKTVLVRNNTAQTYYGVEAVALRWASTAAITSISLYFAGETFSAGTTFSLYGIVSA